MIDISDEIDRVVSGLEEDGYATIPGRLDGEQVGWARADLDMALARTPTGRDDFEGRRTRRIYALFAKTRALDGPATDPIVLGVLDRLLG